MSKCLLSHNYLVSVNPVDVGAKVNGSAFIKGPHFRDCFSQ